MARALRALDIRFRRYPAALRGRPDFVLPERRVVLFVHGCFWHRHRGCPKAATPSTRSAFWQKKFAENVARDRRVVAWLRRHGWSVRTLWECQLARRSEAGLLALVRAKVRGRPDAARAKARHRATHSGQNTRPAGRKRPILKLPARASHHR